MSLEKNKQMIIDWVDENKQNLSDLSGNLELWRKLHGESTDLLNGM